MSNENLVKPSEEVNRQQLLIPDRRRQSHFLHALKSRVFGQDEACGLVADAIVRYESRLNTPGRPLGTFLFLGETGVGKTELGKALAEVLRPNDPQIILVNCAEFAEHHTVMRLLGAPPSYVGRDDLPTITSAFLKQKPNVILFDEIEKADPSLWQLLLSILEEGKLNAREGGKETPHDFSGSFIICTSNVGAEEMARERRPSMGFVPSTPKPLEKVGIAALQEYFFGLRELLGRIENIHVFNSLETQHYQQIFLKYLVKMNKEIRGSGYQFSLSVTEELATNLISIARNTGQYGARDLRNVIESQLKPALTAVIPRIGKNAHITADISSDGNIVFYKETAQISPQPTSSSQHTEATPHVTNPETKHQRRKNRRRNRRD